MTTEKAIRESLAKFGCGLEIHEFKTHDTVTAYPTRIKGVHKIHLTLRYHLKQITEKELLFHLLGSEDYAHWNYLQWEPWL